MAKVKLKYKENKAYFSNIEKKFVKDIEAEIDKVATDIDAEATASINAKAVDQGFLKSKQQYEVNGLTALNYNTANYSPYIEFGTGGLVNVPQGLEDYAIQFKGKGIKQVNLLPRAFLYPAWKKNGIKFIERVNKIINGSKQSN